MMEKKIETIYLIIVHFNEIQSKYSMDLQILY